MLFRSGLFVSACSVNYDIPPSSVTEAKRIIVNSYLNPSDSIWVRLHKLTGRSGAVVGGRGWRPRFLASPERPGCPTSPMRPIGAGVRGARSIHRRVGCPNLLQRPGSGRGAGGESLIFRAFIRGRSGRVAPLQQIRTRLRPGPSREPHPHHPAPAHPRRHNDAGLMKVI